MGEWSEIGERRREIERGNHRRPSPVISRSLRVARGINGWNNVWMLWESVVSRVNMWWRIDGCGGGGFLGLVMVEILRGRFRLVWSEYFRKFSLVSSFFFSSCFYSGRQILQTLIKYSLR